MSPELKRIIRTLKATESNLYLLEEAVQGLKFRIQAYIERHPEDARELSGREMEFAEDALKEVRIEGGVRGEDFIK